MPTNRASTTPNGVINQELVTLEQTPDGIRITRLKRLFSEEAVNSNFESEPISLSLIHISEPTRRS